MMLRNNNNKKRKVDDALTQGNTLLHQAIFDGISQLEMSALLQALGDEAATLAITVNDAGHTPYDLLQKQYPNLYDDTLKQRLLDLMILGSRLPPIRQKLNLSTIKNEYASSASEQLMQNLVFAATIINMVRTTLKSSSTHPDSNALPETDKDELSTKINSMREEKPNIDYNSQGITSSNLNRNAQFYIHNKIGNCSEYAYVAIYYISRHKKRPLTEMYSIKNGDHVFVVLDRAPFSDPREFTTWGENAVVCDAWSGSAFPAAEIPVKLRNYSLIQQFRTLTTYNPAYHGLKCVHRLEMPPALPEAPAATPTETDAYATITKTISSFFGALFTNNATTIQHQHTDSVNTANSNLSPGSVRLSPWKTIR